MASSEFHKLLQADVRIQRIVWFALTASVLIYVLIAYLVTRGASEAPTSTGPMFFTFGLSALALAIAIGAFVYRRYQFSEKRLREKLKKPVNLQLLSKNPHTQAVNPERHRQIGELQPGEQQILALMMSLNQTNIISWALHESIAIYGLLLTILNRNLVVILPFALATIFLNLLAFPKPEAIAERAEQWISTDG